MRDATAADGCDHSIRLFLDGILDDTWLETCCALIDASEDLTMPRGFLFAYMDVDPVSKRSKRRASAIVHPLWRRQGVLRGLIASLRAHDPSSPVEHEICGQSTSGVECAKALGLRRVDAVDCYMVCRSILAPEPARPPLPAVTLTRAGAQDIDEMLAVWMRDRPLASAEEERRNLLSDLDTLQCFMLRTPANAAPIGLITCMPSDKDTYIMNVLVDSASRRLGYAEAMLRAAIRAVHTGERAALPLCLETTNPTAVRLYERVGFRVVHSYETWSELALP